MSRSTTVRSDLILLITAIIWGFAFVAQRMGMEHVGPFLFNGIRFGLGVAVLVMVQWVRRLMDKETGRQGDKGTKGRGDLGTGGQGDLGKTETLTDDRRLTTDDFTLSTVNRQPSTFYGILLGLILFAGASFQQVGIVYTTAGNAGFITGLYVILVPVFGIFSGQKASWNLWIGALFALVGLYFLSVTENFAISRGDMLVVICAVFWAIHVLYTGWLSPRMSAIKLAITQFAVCSILSFISAVLFEKIDFSGIYQAIWPILYGGILSVGIAYTLQIVGQKKAPPAHAAIIMSLEAVFAVIGGVLILSETMTDRKWLGCGLMLLGMVMAQVASHKPQAASRNPEA
jgi:drug/metabolite transporter (DMT)-like permease